MALALKQITIENFKNFRGKHEVPLGRGPALVYVTGDNQVEPDLGANGVGKSTLFDAIFWAFYGKTIRSNRPGSSVEPWEASSAVRVTVDFSNNGVDYRVSRQRNPNGLFLELDDRFKEVTQDVVNKAIGLGEEAFRRTIIVGQFGTLFLDMTATEQSNLFTETLDLDLWLKASDVASRKSQAAIKKADTAKSRLDSLTGTVEEAERNYKAEQEAEEAFEDRLERRMEDNRKRYDDAKAELEKLEDSYPPKPIASGGAKALQDTMDDIQDTINKLRRSESDQRKKLMELHTPVRTLEMQIQQAKNEVRKYEDCKLTRLCPDCGQEVTQSHLIGKLESAQNRRGELEEQWAVAKKVWQDQGDVIETIVQEVEDYTKRLKTVRAEWEAAMSDENAATLAWNSHDRMVQKARADKAGFAAVLKADAEAENPHTKRVRDLSKRIGEFKTERDTAERDYRALLSQVEVCKYWVGAFKEIRLDLINDVIQELEVAVNRHALNLGLVDWYIEFRTSRENKSGNVSLGFTAMIYPPGMETPVPWESYSGGESQRWHLAMTFGLAEVLLDRAGITPNIEVLDEPTQHLSQTGIDALLDHLKARSVELGRTVYFVDHRALDRGSFDMVLNVVKTEDGSCIR